MALILSLRVLEKEAMLLRLLLSIIIAAGLCVPLGRVFAEDLKVETSTLGISLGSDAYLVEVAPGHNKLPRNLSDLESVLVPPGTLLLVFKGNDVRRPSRVIRYLALSEFGEWMYIPGDASNLITQDNLLHALRTRTEDFEWHAFSHKVNTSDPNITFTTGEMVKVHLDPNKSAYVARIERGDEITRTKFEQVKANSKGVGEAGVVLVDLAPQDTAFHFRIPVEGIANYLSVIEWHGLNLDDDRNAGGGIFALLDAMRGAPAQNVIRMHERQKLFEAWPKTIKLGTLFSISCHMASVEQVFSHEDTLKTSLSAGVKLPFPSVEFSMGFGLELVTRAANSLRSTLVPGFSVTETAYVHLSDENQLLTIAKVAECGDGVEWVEPRWHRMHWEPSNPYLFDRRVFESVKVRGASWNRARGVWEIDCFHGPYDSLHDELFRWANSDKQVATFLTRYVSPSGDRDDRWQTVFNCETPSETPVPRPRPEIDQPQVSRTFLQ